METRFLESLLAIVENGSIAGAARVQGLTAAAVNQRIKTLEGELQTTLFKRAGKTVLPTDDCIRLIPHAEKITADARLMRNHLDETGLTTELKVGLISTTMVRLIPDTLVSLKRLAPNITLDIRPGTSTFLYDLICQGKLDVAVLISPPFDVPKNIHSQLLRIEPLMFVGHKKLKLSIAEALESQPYIRYGSNSWGGQLANRYLRDHNMTPEVFCTINDMETSAKMVAKGLGVSLLPDWCGREHVSSNLLWTAISGVEYHRRIVILQRPGSGKEKALSVFTEVLKDVHHDLERD